MQLDIGRIRIKNLAFSDKTYIENGILYINKEELQNYIKEDKNIKNVDIDFARPGESTRIGRQKTDLLWNCSSCSG